MNTTPPSHAEHALLAIINLNPRLPSDTLGNIRIKLESQGEEDPESVAFILKVRQRARKLKQIKTFNFAMTTIVVSSGVISTIFRIFPVIAILSLVILLICVWGIRMNIKARTKELEDMLDEKLF
ncbi:MAG: hypothetical protein QNJ46_35400 [Leptolyngbyaceae cyanobacterium MO_188.B28]|nr:hypothetical protein [Leptolyngbyaceae cyanobacterium MO_188.B28]